MIKAKTELLSSKTNFERITREKVPLLENLKEAIIIDLPNSINTSLELANLRNLELLITKLDYEISIKNLNIERSRLSPSASLQFQNLKIKILAKQ